MSEAVTVIDVVARVTDETASGANGAERNVSNLERSMMNLQRQLQGMRGKSKLEVACTLKDMATKGIQAVAAKGKQIAGKVWTVTMKAKDLVTAPFKKIWGMIANPLTAAAGAAGISFGLGDTLKTGAEFEAAMSQVSAVSGATGADLDMLTAKAREMGAKTQFSAKDAADAFNYMAMAGWKPHQMEAGIEGIMNLAAASGESLGTTSDIVTDALTAFGMKADESGHFADVLAQASSNANTNVGMMGETFKYAAPVAGALGYSAEDTAIAIGLMANAGIKASSAGTAIRGGLARLVKPTKQVAEAMDKYGISLTNGEGRMYSMREMMVQLRDKLGGLDEAEQGAAAGAIFGTNAMSGWLAVVNASQDDFDKLAGSIDNCDGASARMAETMNDNLQGSLKKLGSAAQELQLSLYESLGPIAKDAVDWVTGEMPQIQDALTKGIDFIKTKVGEAKKAFDELRATDEWKNADFFGKVHLAWDRLIAEPFNEWWSGGGQEWAAKKAGEIGNALGTGLKTGILALLGMDATGAFDDGKSIAKSFASGFAEGFEGEKVGKAIMEAIKEGMKAVTMDAATLLPGGKDPSATSGLSALLLGAGAFKLGKMGMGLVKGGAALLGAGTAGTAASAAAAGAAGAVGAGAAGAAGAGAATGILATISSTLSSILAAIAGIAAPIAAIAAAIGGGLMLGNFLGKGMDKGLYENFRWLGEGGFFDQIWAGDISHDNPDHAENTLESYKDWGKAFAMMWGDLWKGSASSDWQAQGEGNIDKARRIREREWEKLWRGDTSGHIEKAPFDTSDAISRQMEANARAQRENLTLPSAGASRTLDSIEILPGKVDASEIENALTDSLDKAYKTALQKSPDSGDAIARRVEATKSAIESRMSEMQPSQGGGIEDVISRQLDTAQRVAEEKTKGIEDVISRQLETAQRTAEEKAGGIAEAASTKLDSAAGGVEESLSGIEGAVGESLDGVAGTIDEKLSGIEESLSEASEGIEAAASTASEAAAGIGEAASGQTEALKSTAEETASSLETMNERAKEGLESLKGSVEESSALIQESMTSMTETVQTSAETMTATLEGFSTTATGLMETAAASMASAFESQDWESVGMNVTRGIASGIESGIPGIETAAKSAAERSLRAAKESLDIHSPSKKAAKEVGEPISQGVAAGILNAMGIAEDAAVKLADKTTVKLKEAFGKRIESLAGTIKGQMDIFSKFEAPEAMDPAELISNMESQVKGVTDWAMKVNGLAFKGVDQKLLQKLGDMGPQGAKYVDAFSKMSAEQIQKANALFAQSEALPTQAAGLIEGSYVEAGQFTALGFAKGVDEGSAAAAESMTKMGDLALSSLKGILEIGSPSEATKRMGIWLIEGLGLGLTDEDANEGLLEATQHMTDTANDKMEEELGIEKMHEFGLDMMEGLENGIRDGTAGIEAAIQAVAEKVNSAISQIQASLASASSSVGTSSRSKSSGGGSSSGGGASSSAAAHAEGGIMTTPHMGLVAEDGAEAIIPLAGKRRQRGISVWKQAGKLLGIPGYAEGGVIGRPEPVPSPAGNAAPGPERIPEPIPATAGAPGTVQINVSMGGQEFHIEGGDSDGRSAVDAVMSHMDEVSEAAAMRIAKALAQIFPNMPISGVV